MEGFTSNLKTKEQEVEEKQAALIALQTAKDASDIELASLKAALDAAKASSDAQVQDTIVQVIHSRRTPICNMLMALSAPESPGRPRVSL